MVYFAQMSVQLLLARLDTVFSTPYNVCVSSFVCVCAHKVCEVLCSARSLGALGFIAISGFSDL